MGEMRQYPSISVVIPSFNQGQYIEETFLSIIGQHYPNLEIIVIDGGSSDNTVEIIEKYTSYLTYWHSRKDQGQTDAINQGMRLSSGDILCWLNSDDLLLPCALDKLVACLGEVSQPKLMYGGCLRFMQGTNDTYGRLSEPFDPERLTYYNYIDQPSVFWTRALWEHVGELNESYHYVMDWDWWIRASRVCQFLTVPEYLSIFRLHSAHKSGTGGLQRRAEIVKIVDTYSTIQWKSVFHDMYGKEDMIRKRVEQLSNIGLHEFRYVCYPRLWYKHRRYRLDIALSM